MARYRLIKSIAGGSDVYDESGNQVGYSLPSITGDGEDFYTMDGRPVGQTFSSVFGGEYFSGPDAHGFLDSEFIMGQNAYLNGDPFKKEDFSSIPDLEDPYRTEGQIGTEDPFGDSDIGMDDF